MRPAIKTLILSKSPLPALHAPLLADLRLVRGDGTPSFTRATTATVTDFEGLIKTAKSGEARFEGARRVESLIPTPSNSLTVGNNKTVTVAAGTYVFSMGAGASSGVATFSGTGGATGTLTQDTSNRTAQNEKLWLIQTKARSGWKSSAGWMK